MDACNVKVLTDLSGKKALVTGGSRGVGLATARLLAQAGADVGISYHSREAAAQSAVEELQGFGVRAWAEGGDVSNPEVVARLFGRVDSEFGGIELFVANAGIWPAEDVAVEDLTMDRWERTLSVNLTGVFRTTQEALKRYYEKPT